MQKILFSLGVIGAVSALAIGATTAFFTDTETSAGNTFTAGTIDIAVDGENPWTTHWSNYLDKPSQTNYLVFRVQNVGENPADVYKKITNVQNSGGLNVYPTSTPALASSESEYEAGGGTFIGGQPTGQGYTERDNLSAFMVYDMAVCKVGAPLGENNEPCACETQDSDGNGNGAPIAQGQCWQVLIAESSQVRVDNVIDVWRAIAEELKPEETVAVAQSYHLMSWDDSGEPIIMNWAQGDVMTFDIALEARQIDAEAPGVTTNEQGAPTATVTLAQKDSAWNIISGGASGTLTYGIIGPTFNFNFSAAGLAGSANYCLIYYADPWPGTGGQEIMCGNSVDGILALSGSPDTGTIPVGADANAAVGGKVWLVPAVDYDTANDVMIAWNPSQYLFDVGLVNYVKP